jgi:hypothetical protein
MKFKRKKIKKQTSELLRRRTGDFVLWQALCIIYFILDIQFITIDKYIFPNEV